MEPQISRNFGLRSVGVCSAYPSFDKPFLKVYADERRLITMFYHNINIKSPAPICSRSSNIPLDPNSSSPHRWDGLFPLRT